MEVLFISLYFNEDVGRAGRVAQVLEHLPSKCETVSPNPVTRRRNV
jgi:hypothetical protein